MILSVFGMTHKGRIRPHNEDALLVAPSRGLFAVADGMGGHAAGEVASRLAIEAVEEVFSDGDFEGGQVPELLYRSVEEANRRIAERIREVPEYYGMGTTLVVGVVMDERMWIAHVGDSRAYRVRGEQIEQLTTDHSLVNELVRLGILSKEKAATDPRRNVVTRALGSGVSVTPDLVEQSLESGDLILLCSDGLNTMLDDDLIVKTATSSGDDLEQVCNALISAANEAGGEDNVTVVLLSPKAQDSGLEETASARADGESGDTQPS